MQGWRNLNERMERVKHLERHYREVGYSDGYGMKLAKSLDVDYQRGWKRGRAARREFDASGDAA